MFKPVWGIIGIGWIGSEMAEALQKAGKTVHAACSRNLERTEAFCQKYGITKAYTDYHDLLADPEINIVYIATPHSNHYEVMKDALNAGKNVFCEKAITVNSDQLEECVAIANEKDLAIMDGVTLFHMPVYTRLKNEILPKLGKIKMIQVNFGSLKDPDPANRFYSMDLAGGALLDIGVYAISFARYFMCENPEVVLTTMERFVTGVDESSGILLKNPSGEIATISLTFRAKQPKRCMVAGENGYFEIYNFPRGNEAILTDPEGHQTTIQDGKSEDALLYELEAMEAYASHQADWKPNLDMIRSVMKVMTDVRKQWNLVYPFEK